jgi:putative oxidoreductase
MKIAATIARYLLGLMFTVFGLNGFLNFIKQPPPTNPLAIQFFTAVAASHYAYMFFALQLVAGLMLLSGYYVPLALAILAAEILNILTFHVTMNPEGIAPGLLALVLWMLVFTQYRRSFQPLLQAKPEAL